MVLGCKGHLLCKCEKSSLRYLYVCNYGRTRLSLSQSSMKPEFRIARTPTPTVNWGHATHHQQEERRSTNTTGTSLGRCED